jgi:hypothetical protein
MVLCSLLAFKFLVIKDFFGGKILSFKLYFTQVYRIENNRIVVKYRDTYHVMR